VVIRRSAKSAKKPTRAEKPRFADESAIIAAKREALEEAAREADTFTSSADPDVVARWLRKRAKGVRA
jgi:hypothetical protein